MEREVTQLREALTMQAAVLQAEIDTLRKASAVNAACRAADKAVRSAARKAKRRALQIPVIGVCTDAPLQIPPHRVEARVDRSPRAEDGAPVDIPPHRVEARVDRSPRAEDGAPLDIPPHRVEARVDRSPRAEDGAPVDIPPHRVEARVDRSPRAEDGADDAPLDSRIPSVEGTLVARRRLELYDTWRWGVLDMAFSAKAQLVKTVFSPERLRQCRLTAQLAEDTGLSRRCLLSGPRKVRKNTAASMGLEDRIIEFLKRPEHSYTLPGKKDTVTMSKVKHQKVILTEFTDTLHALFKEEYPTLTCGRTTFNDVRRRHKYIKTVKFNNTRVCLCLKHQNFTLRLRAVGMWYVLPDELVRNTTAEDFAADLRAKDLPPTITVETWQRVDVPYGTEGKTCKKLRQVESVTPKEDFIKALALEFTAMKEHCNRAQKQHRVVRQLRERMTPAECTIQMDFAENWMVSYPEEPQAVYYAKEPVTLHPAVIHHREGEVTTHWCVALVTDDRKHDSGAILSFLEVLCEYVKDTLPEVTTIHYVSDSPSSQYRNKSIFSILCKYRQLFTGLQATWTYFESGHGKGPCDGVGAAAKRNADLAVNRNVQITDAASFAELGNSLEGSVHYVCVPVADVARCRDKVLEIVCENTVPGTMTVHAVVPLTEDHTIAVRATSCFEGCCWADCKSERGCPGWKVHQIFPNQLAEPPAEEAEVEPAAQPRIVARPERYEVGDWLACTYETSCYVGQVTAMPEDWDYTVKFLGQEEDSNPPGSSGLVLMTFWTLTMRTL